MQKISTLLMFEGRAEEAINLYISLFPNSSIVQINRYTKDGPGADGIVMHATFMINGIEFTCIDSPAVHGFTFTPAMSLSAICVSEPEIDRIFEKLAAGGKVMMALSAYPFAKKFGWLTDQFGVSWQLTLKPQD